MKRLTLTEGIQKTAHGDEYVYQVLEDGKPILAWHNVRKIPVTEVFVTRDSNGNFMRDNALPTDRAIYGIATLTEFFDRSVPVNHRGFITEAI